MPPVQYFWWCHYYILNQMGTWHDKIWQYGLFCRLIELDNNTTLTNNAIKNKYKNPWTTGAGILHSEHMFRIMRTTPVIGTIDQRKNARFDSTQQVNKYLIILTISTNITMNTSFPNRFRWRCQVLLWICLHPWWRWDRPNTAVPREHKMISSGPWPAGVRVAKSREKCSLVKKKKNAKDRFSNDAYGKR